jgi:hypothetical protein
LPNSSKFNFKSAIKYPFFINLSKKNNWGLLFIDLINATKFLSKIGLVDISICELTNWLLINEFNDIWVLIYSSSIGFPIKVIFASIVFALILKFNGSKVSFIFFKLVSNLSFLCLTKSWIWLLNFFVSIPTVLK